MGGIVGDPQGESARNVESERTHPTAPEHPPPSFRRKQLMVLGGFVLLLIVIAVVVSRLG